MFYTPTVFTASAVSSTGVLDSQRLKSFHMASFPFPVPLILHLVLPCLSDC